ncbi:FkbM family methyltransferase [uncultured Nostoc sp.]|uniref:FkbM family methyltransferase n=1 Tax=uncultured Nostoc sp. TaxID=340711 RepID=UPI0035C99494
MSINFSGISNQTILGKILRFPLQFIPATTVMPILQGKLKGKKWIIKSGQHGAWLGSYEYEKQIIFQQIIKEGSIIYDLGSNSGFHTILASVLVGSQGKVVAFEPHPQNLHYLKQHLQLNHLENVIVIDKAVSDSSGVIQFDGSGFTGHISSQGELQVKTVSLDELIDTKQIPPPSFLKIDIEGAEMLALSGAKSMLSKIHPTILLATHGTEVHEQCCQFLNSLGYTLETIYGEDIQNSNEIIAYFNG